VKTEQKLCNFMQGGEERGKGGARTLSNLARDAGRGEKDGIFQKVML